MTNIINEHLSKSDESVEVVELKNGNLWIYIKDGECIIFPVLISFINYILGISTKRKYCNEGDLMGIYEKATSFYDIEIAVTN